MTAVDRLLAEAMLLLPAPARVRLLEHLDAGGQLCVDYGWDWRRPARPARRGCLVGVGLAPQDFARCWAEGGGDDLVWLAEEAFPTWASRWVTSPEEELPPPALARLRQLLESERLSHD